MRIIIIDDQKLILLSLKKKLSEIGYEVKTASTKEEGIKLIESFKPDLVTVDISMPEMAGIEILKHIKESSIETKTVVTSGSKEEDIVLELFEYGVDEYIRKPVSLSEITVRINKLIGAPPFITNEKTEGSNTIIREKCIGVVIPCYNEVERLSDDIFTHFTNKNLGYHLCFVNDGSTDNTLQVLNKLQETNKDHISVYDCAKNGGKAEAVRQGMLYLTNDTDLNLDYIGFLDADLSTDFNDFDNLVNTIEMNDYKIVSGSRIDRMGANIARQSSRQLISLIINYIIQKILGMKFKDTQCGAKIIDKELIPILFNDKFITRWLFDVEMFLRLKKHYGEKANKMICEQPLRRWVHVDGSKLSMKDSLSIALQLRKIATFYK